MLHNRLIATLSSVIVYLGFKYPVQSPAIPGLKYQGVCVLCYSKCNFDLSVAAVTQCLTLVLSPHF